MSPFKSSVVGYLDVNEQLAEVFGRHDNGDVEGDDEAAIDLQVQVGGQHLGEAETQ